MNQFRVAQRCMSQHVCHPSYHRWGIKELGTGISNARKNSSIGKPFITITYRFYNSSYLEGDFMDFIEQLRVLSARIEEQKDVIQTEEATKTAFVMPFINLLGYDVFNPREVVPEYTADVGVKQGEKVDYAIFKDENAIMLIECKKYGEDLSDVHTTQLFRYFSAVHARFAVLTDGVLYRFYTDLEETNKMDIKPFLEFNMFDIQPTLANELKRFTKSAFNLDQNISAASDLKYTKEIKQILMEQLEAPHTEFVRFFLSTVYSGVKTQSVMEQFTEIVRRALHQFLNEQLNYRLQSAIKEENTAEDTNEVDDIDESIEEDSNIVTTEEELEGYYIVKSIVREVVDPERIFHRDTVSYMGIILDDSRKKPICRLYFNSDTKYLGLLDSENLGSGGLKRFDRVELRGVDDIYNYAEALKLTAQSYDNLISTQTDESTEETEEFTN